MHRCYYAMGSAHRAGKTQTPARDSQFCSQPHRKVRVRLRQHEAGVDGEIIELATANQRLERP